MFDHQLVRSLAENYVCVSHTCEIEIDYNQPPELFLQAGRYEEYGGKIRSLLNPKFSPGLPKVGDGKKLVKLSLCKFSFPGFVESQYREIIEKMFDWQLCNRRAASIVELLAFGEKSPCQWFENRIYTTGTGGVDGYCCRQIPFLRLGEKRIIDAGAIIFYAWDHYYLTVHTD